jgi:hypothetical protein
MSTFSTSSNDALPRLGLQEWRVRNPLWTGTTTDLRAAEIIDAYAGHIVDGHELVRRLRIRESQPISVVAKLLVNRQLLSFSWRGQFILPLFQFCQPDMSVLPAVGDVLAELGTAFDNEDASIWFCRANSSLANATPMDTIERDPGAVIAAARMDHFALAG